MTADAISSELVAAFVEAYPHVVRGRLADRSVDPPGGLDEALESGASWLHEELGALLARPFGEQRRGPLEVLQEAMRFPTEALAAAGVSEPDRDEAAVSALPGDVFDLAPASSQDLGERAWHAHLAWGAAKAAARRPVVGLLSADLMDASRIEPAVTSAGLQLATWRRGSDVTDPPPRVAFVDLAHRDADEVIGRLAAAGCRVVGFGPHVDDLAMVRARSLGAVDAVARSRFFRDVAGHLPTLA